MADLGGMFNPKVEEFLPDRLALDDEKLLAAFEVHQRRKKIVGSKLTMARLCDEVGLCDRVFRKVRSGEGTLARHQVIAIAKLLGCMPGDIIQQRIATHNTTNQRRRRAELYTSAVPLT